MKKLLAALVAVFLCLPAMAQECVTEKEFVAAMIEAGDEYRVYGVISYFGQTSDATLIYGDSQRIIAQPFKNGCALVEIALPLDVETRPTPT